jgi:hypothetical protein
MGHKGNVRYRWVFSRPLTLHFPVKVQLLTDPTNRRPNSQKAWTTGANPITQKSSAPPQQNGNVLQAKQIATVKTSQQKDTATPDRHANDRLVFLLAAAIVSHPNPYCISSLTALLRGHQSRLRRSQVMHTKAYSHTQRPIRPRPT